MYLTVCQQLKHLSKDEFLILRELCRTAKNLTNQAIYQIRQHYFEHSQYLPYEKNYAILKTSENYRLLNSNMAQQILKEVDGSFKSFFGLLKLAKQGKYPFSSCRLPKYLPKDGYATLIVGYNTTFQRSSDLGRQMNQVFVGIPFGILRRKLKYLCEMNGIRYVEQEESYTSMASFWDLDEMPVYGEAGLVPPVFSGRRICRGLYQDRSGRRINADVNGALNIMRKCNIVSLRALYDRGDVDTPVRIRIA